MINPNNYYTVHGWMLSDLRLKGNALAVYAIIYGFSQDGVSEYAGSSKYLCEWLGCSKKTVLTTLADLTKKGYLIKKIVDQNGIKCCNYVAVRRPFKAVQPGEENTPTGEEITPGAEKNLHQGGEEITPGWCKNYTGGGEEITPHIILDKDSNNTIHKDIYSAPENNEPQESPKKRGRKKTAGDGNPKPEKKLYGEFQHVKLTDEEHAKLVKKHGEEKTAQLIQYLDEYIEEKPAYKSQSHYLAISRWVVDAVNERRRRRHIQQGQARQAARGGNDNTVGPNGITIDPTKDDLDGAF